MLDGDQIQLAHIGFVWPDTGDALELFEMADGMLLTKAVGCKGLKFTVDYSRGPQGHGIDALSSVGETEGIAAAGRRLADAGAQAIVWACTSGSFIGGLEWSLNQRRELRDRIGLPVTTGILALISSCMRLGFESVDVLSPYPRDVSDILGQVLESAGLTVTSMRVLNSPGATASAKLPLAEECRRFRAFGNLAGDGVLVPDTAVNSLELIPELEAALGRSVLTVNQACVFEGAEMIGGSGALTELSAFRRFTSRPNGRIL